MSCRFRLFAILLLTSIGSALSEAQDEHEGFTFLPGTTLFQPITAASQEPRVGVRKQIGSAHLKLDIGTTFDLLEYTISGGQSKRLRMGIDFFTYALSTNIAGRRLQIDAVDGFFGGHISYTPAYGAPGFSARLRILHLSAHFLDGHYDIGAQKWKDGRDPIPFTKDFGELIGAYTLHLSNTSLMVYSGLSYATLVRPAEIQRVSTIHGFEIHNSEFPGEAFGKPANLYLGGNLSVVGIPEYTGTSNVELGVKFGEWSGSGIRISVNYFTGLDVFSQYYNVRRKEWGLGLVFDAW